MRAKQVVSFLTAVSLTLGMATSAFAAQSYTSYTNRGIANRTGTSAPETAEAAASASADAKIKANDSIFTNRTGLYNYGVYPVLTDSAYASLNVKIENDLFQTFRTISPTHLTDVVQYYTKVSYTITDEDVASIIKVNTLIYTAYGLHTLKDVTSTYYVDTDTKKEITEAEYDELVAAAEEAAEEEETATEDEAEETPADVEESAEVANEVALVPLRKYAEQLGFSVDWSNAINGVVVSNGTLETIIVTDENAYVTADGNVIELEVAPVIQDGTLLVPVSFFTEILGAQVQYDADGDVEAIVLK